MGKAPGESTPLLEADGKISVPPATFSSALKREDGSPRQIPQAVGHRGYKAAFPENTMAAFKAAMEIGAHGLETDTHLSKDGVVVLSHDATLKRCFGEDKKIAQCDWEYLSTVRTTRKPSQPMPRLVDLLEYLAQPELEDKWMLLDIKRDDDPAELVKRIAETINSVSTERPWSQRIVLGCWSATWAKLCLKHLPDFPLAYIGFSLTYARQLLQAIPNMNFNMLQYSLAGPCGSRFIADAKAADRRIFDWTVNDESWMEWSIGKELDAVITDDPKLFLEVCARWTSKEGKGRDRWRATRQRPLKATLKETGFFMLFYVLTFVVAMVFAWRTKGTPAMHIKKALKE